MSRNGKVVIAMSGGVDSSVAACLLREQGFDCVGVFMRVGVQAEAENCAIPAAVPGAGTSLPLAPRRLKHGCCSATDALDARVIAEKLGIPFYALNFRDDFDRIINYFVDEYERARTPNPCVMCNIHLKFGKLFKYADLVDAEFVATGHYARILPAADGGAAPFLARAVNHDKDQSYVLFGIRRENLARCRFPIGEIADKALVRQIAADLGLRVADKPDSQEICFVPDNDYRRLIAQRRPHLLRPGEVRDAQGHTIGKHEGVAGFTIGQRRGLRIAAGRPIYVTRLEPQSNVVTVGPREDLASRGLVAGDINWLSDLPPAGAPRPAHIKIRHMHTAAPGVISVLENGEVRAAFDDPQDAVTPGQAAVFYDGDLVLGGGFIREALR